MILSPRLAPPSPLPARHPQTQRALVRGHEQSVDPHSSRIERPAARGGVGEEERWKLEGSEGRSAHRGAACRRPARPRCRPQSRTALTAASSTTASASSAHRASSSTTARPLNVPSRPYGAVPFIAWRLCRRRAWFDGVQGRGSSDTHTATFPRVTFNRTEVMVGIPTY